MANFINREKAYLLTTNREGFYTTPAPTNIDDRNFLVADALDALFGDLADLQYSISDNPSPAQVEVINEAYSKFIKALPNKTAPKNKKVKS